MVTAVDVSVVAVVDAVAAVVLETDFAVVMPLVVALPAVVIVLPETAVVVGVPGRIILHGTDGTHKFRRLSAASNPLAMNARRRSGSPFIVTVTVC